MVSASWLLVPDVPVVPAVPVVPRRTIFWNFQALIRDCTGEMDDRDLLERARHGDEPAFSLLFARHQRPLFQYAAYMCGSGSADDIVQETFLVVLRQTGRRDAPTGSVLGYLIGIARHLVMKRQGRTSEWAVDDATLEQAPSAQPSAFDCLMTA